MAVPFHWCKSPTGASRGRHWCAVTRLAMGRDSPSWPTIAPDLPTSTRVQGSRQRKAPKGYGRWVTGRGKRGDLLDRGRHGPLDYAGIRLLALARASNRDKRPCWAACSRLSHLAGWLCHIWEPAYLDQHPTIQPFPAISFAIQQISPSVYWQPGIKKPPERMASGLFSRCASLHRHMLGSKSISNIQTVSESKSRSDRGLSWRIHASMNCFSS